MSNLVISLLVKTRAAGQDVDLINDREALLLLARTGLANPMTVANSDIKIILFSII